MKKELEGLSPEDALQQITAHPDAIALEHWRELFVSYATNRHGRITQDKITDWIDFTRFIDGQVTPEEYYGTAHGTRNHTESVMARMGDQDQQAYRIELNELLAARIRAARGDAHWSEAALNPALRMYLDAARLCNRDVMTSSESWEIKKFPSPHRPSYEADIQEKMADAFDEALLSPTMRPESLSGFAVAVIKRRLIDFHRARLGRHENARSSRPSIVSLDAPALRGESKDISLLDTLDERNLHHAHHGLDAEGLIDEIRQYAAHLPEAERRLLTAYLEEKAEDPKASNRKISEGLGIKEPTFRGQIVKIIEKMGRRSPGVREYLQNRNAVEAHFRQENKAPQPAEPSFNQAKPFAERVPKKKPPISQAVRDLKDKMRAIFMDDSNPVTLSQIAGDVQLSHMVVLSGLMGANNNTNPAAAGALSDNVHDKLTHYLEAKGRGDKLGEFDELFTQMRKECGYSGRLGRSRSGGGFVIG